MDHSKLDAKLSEALSDPADDPALFEVFIDLDRQPAADDLQRLDALGVQPTGPGAILTAEVTRDALEAICELPAVRHVALKRRLRKRRQKA